MRRHNGIAPWTCSWGLMPILLPPNPDAPLTQGDVLNQITTHIADVDGSPSARADWVIVVSRPCKAIRASTIIVAPIGKRPLQDIRNDRTFGGIVRFFDGVRDAHGAPDSFYLGEFQAGSSDRY